MGVLVRYTGLENRKTDGFCYTSIQIDTYFIFPHIIICTYWHISLFAHIIIVTHVYLHISAVSEPQQLHKLHRAGDRLRLRGEKMFMSLLDRFPASLVGWLN